MPVGMSKGISHTEQEKKENSIQFSWSFLQSSGLLTPQFNVAGHVQVEGDARVQKGHGDKSRAEYGNGHG